MWTYCTQIFRWASLFFVFVFFFHKNRSKSKKAQSGRIQKKLGSLCDQWTCVFFSIDFFGFEICGYYRVNYVFFSVFQKFIAFSLSLFSKKKKAFVFSYGSELFLSRTLWSLFLFLSRLVYRFKKFIAFLLSLATIKRLLAHTRKKTYVNEV